MSDNEIEVTIQGQVGIGSNLSNYSDAFEAWDEEEGEECPDCRGSGLDRDEIYECLTCYGEGYIVTVDRALIKIRKTEASDPT